MSDNLQDFYKGKLMAAQMVQEAVINKRTEPQTGTFLSGYNSVLTIVSNLRNRMELKNASSQDLGILTALQEIEDKLESQKCEHYNAYTSPTPASAGISVALRDINKIAYVFSKNLNEPYKMPQDLAQDIENEKSAEKEEQKQIYVINIRDTEFSGTASPVLIFQSLDALVNEISTLTEESIGEKSFTETTYIDVSGIQLDEDTEATVASAIVSIGENEMMYANDDMYNKYKDVFEQFGFREIYVDEEIEPQSKEDIEDEYDGQDPGER